MVIQGTFCTSPPTVATGPSPIYRRSRSTGSGRLTKRPTKTTVCFSYTSHHEEHLPEILERYESTGRVFVNLVPLHYGEVATIEIGGLIVIMSPEKTATFACLHLG